MKIAINGFGRIGRLFLRALCERKEKNIEVVAINDLSSIEEIAHLFTYDSVHGRFQDSLKINNGALDVGPFKNIKILSEAKPENLPWSDLGIDMVVECSGRFTTHESASLHLKAGAKRVLVSAPCKDADITVVYGVNHDKITDEHKVISNASCTTNCLAPVAAVLHENVGIEMGYMTTIHAYTGDQRLVDTHHKDLRRSRAAAVSMIPSTTGAAKAVGLVLPELAGKLDGTAIRVPTPNVSVVDFKFLMKKQASAQDLNGLFVKASQTHLKGVLGVSDLPLVSCDFNHSSESSIVDLDQTSILEGKFGRVLTWYDNEWGFSNRLCDVINVMQ